MSTPALEQVDEVVDTSMAPARAGALPQPGFLKTAPSGYDRGAIRDPGGVAANLSASVARLAHEAAAISSGQTPEPIPQAPLRAVNLPQSGNPLAGGQPTQLPPDRGSLETFIEPQPAQPAPVERQSEPPKPRDYSSRFREQAVKPELSGIPPPPPVDPMLERIEISDPNDPRVAHAFGSLRSSLKQQKDYAAQVAAQAAAIKKEIEDAKKERDAVAAQLEAERTRAKELDEKVSKLSLVESPSFRQKFDAPIDELVSKTTKFLLEGGLAQDARVAEKRAKELLEADAHDIVEATETLPRSVVNQMVALAAKHTELRGERDRALKDWKVAKTAAEKSFDMASTEERLQSRKMLAEKALEHARAVSPVLAASSGKGLDLVREIENQFVAFAQHATEDELMRCASEGFAAQELYDEVNQLRQQLAEANARLTGRRVAGLPPIAPTYTAPTPPAPPAPPPVYTPPNVKPVNTNPDSTRSYLETVVGRDIREAQAPFRQRGRF